eukprot:m51a1_g11408 hypothetical protein (725) ;mRNA; f:11339-14200
MSEQQFCTCGDFLPRVSLDCRLCAHPYRPPSPKQQDINSRLVAFVQSAHLACSPLVPAIKSFDASRPDELRAALQAAEKIAADSLRALLAPEFAAIAEREASADRARRRQHIIEEIADTEQDYVRDLETIDAVWRRNAAQAGFLAPQEMHVLFGTIPQLRFLAGELARELREVRNAPVAEQCIGEIFSKKIPFFRLYIEYCANQSAAAEIIARLAFNPKYLAFKEKMRGEPATKQLELNGFLIKPTQRITKYPLFLKDLLRFTDHAHPDYKNLLAASESLFKVITEVNEKTRLQESFDVLTRLQPTIVWKPGAQLDFVALKCTVVRTGKLVCYIIPKSDRVKEPIKGNLVFLLSTYLLVLTEAGPKKIAEACFKVQDIALADESSGMKTARKTVEFKVKGDTAEYDVIMHCSDVLERQYWLSSIREALAGVTPRKAPTPVQEVLAPKAKPPKAALDIGDMPTEGSSMRSDPATDSIKDVTPLASSCDGMSADEDADSLSDKQKGSAQRSDSKHRKHKKHRGGSDEPADDKPLPLNLASKRASLTILASSIARSTDDEDVCASARGPGEVGMVWASPGSKDEKKRSNSYAPAPQSEPSTSPTGVLAITPFPSRFNGRTKDETGSGGSSKKSGGRKSKGGSLGRDMSSKTPPAREQRGQTLKEFLEITAKQATPSFSRKASDSDNEGDGQTLKLVRSHSGEQSKEEFHSGMKKSQSHPDLAQDIPQ